LNVNADGTILSSSPGACSAWGYGCDSLIARSWDDLAAGEDAGAARQLLQQACERPPGRTVSGEFRIQHADGTLHDYEVVAANELTDEPTPRLVLSCHDISERKAFERELTRRAFHDPLTSLPNRALFLSRVDNALARSERSNMRVAVLYLDLDNFKIVNDTWGHAAGDALLLSFADRLLSCVRDGDTVARLGGDEFAILLEPVPGLEEAEQAAWRIAEALRVPFEIEDHTLHTTASVGIALAEPHARDAAALIRAADLALYRAKGGGKARYAVYDSSMAADYSERVESEDDLRRALGPAAQSSVVAAPSGLGRLEGRP
jgi:diguanylate cyclase (GGDEF)-like protein/PAS domain S-box-containing protein